MSAKDWVSGPHIPAVVQALGAFAVAAGVSAAIHWYLSRDSQKEASEGAEAGLERDQDVIEDGQFPRDSPEVPDEEPGENIQAPQVSDQDVIKDGRCPRDSPKVPDEEPGENIQAPQVSDQDVIKDGWCPRDSPKVPDEEPGENVQAPQVSEQDVIKDGRCPRDSPEVPNEAPGEKHLQSLRKRAVQRVATGTFGTEAVQGVARGSFVSIPKHLHYGDVAERFQLTLGNCLPLLQMARENHVPGLLHALYTVLSDNYLNVLKDSAIYGHLTGSQRKRILQMRMTGTLSLCKVKVRGALDLNTHTGCSAEADQSLCGAQLYSLHMYAHRWTMVTAVPEEACLVGCSMCSMHNYLFIAGGIRKTNEGSVCTNTFMCYNPRTGIWSRLPPMIQARSHLKLIPLDGCLYAIGGKDLNTMEKYDPKSDTWTLAAPLPKGSCPVVHEAAACGGRIYLTRKDAHHRLFCYTPGRDRWKRYPYEACRGRPCDMVAIGSSLYRFDLREDSVNIIQYDTTTKKQSQYRTTFPGSKAPFRCAALQYSIYCANTETTARFSVHNGKAELQSADFRTVPVRGVDYPCLVGLYLRPSFTETSI
ncbi:kelch domain-containing protein 7B-like [Pseudophryne corroboree]|uniref:kelch domain-containing protein 7B-like n=1 Tax=Pseudophryne corroboree TaxID=495146 RepID=UPI0030818D29